MLTSDEVIDKIRLIVGVGGCGNGVLPVLRLQGQEAVHAGAVPAGLDMSGVTREMEMARVSEEELYGLMDRYRSKSDPGKAFRRRPTPADHPPRARARAGGCVFASTAARRRRRDGAVFVRR